MGAHQKAEKSAPRSRRWLPLLAIAILVPPLLLSATGAASCLCASRTARLSGSLESVVFRIGYCSEITVNELGCAGALGEGQSGYAQQCQHIHGRDPYPAPAGDARNVGMGRSVRLKGQGLDDQQYQCVSARHSDNQQIQASVDKV